MFGSFTSSLWRPLGPTYYGSGEAFLWRLKQSKYTPCATVAEQIELESNVEVFAWTGKNRNVQYFLQTNVQFQYTVFFIDCRELRSIDRIGR